MRPAFRFSGGRVEVRLEMEERQILGMVPTLAADREDADGRLDYRAHPDDPDAEARYRDLIGDDLNELRAEDLSGFQAVVTDVDVTIEDLEAFTRVVGEARLVLAARLGIEEDGWEADAPTNDPETALLSWLGYLQESAVNALAEAL